LSQSLKIRERATNSQNFEIEKRLSSDSSLYKKIELIQSNSNSRPTISNKNQILSHKGSVISSKSPLKSSNNPSVSQKNPLKSDKSSSISKRSENPPSVSSKNSSIPNNSSQGSKKNFRPEKTPQKSGPESSTHQVHLTEKSPSTLPTSKNPKDIPKFKGLIIDTSFNDSNNNLNSPSHLSEKEEFLYINESSKISENEKVTFFSKKPSIQDSPSQDSINFSHNEYNEYLGQVSNKEKSEETNLDTIKNLRPEQNSKKSKKKKFELSAEVSSSMGLEKLPEQDSEINLRASLDEIKGAENPFNLIIPSQETAKKNPLFSEYIDSFSLCESIIDSIISQIPS